MFIAGRIHQSIFKRKSGITVAPAMNGHPRDQAKVSLHDRWPLVRGTEGRASGGAPKVAHLARLHYASPPAIFILNTMSCIVIMMKYVCYSC